MRGADRHGLLRAMVEDDLEQVLAWRNHPEVRRWMYTTHEISLEEHRAWFASLMADPLRHAFVFEDAGEPLGCVNFTCQEASPEVAYWGFYLAPAAPRGTGTTLGQVALDHAFGVMKLVRVIGEALASNSRSIAFHRRHGFSEEQLLRGHHHGADGATHDVLRFQLTRPDWMQRIHGKTP